MTSPCSAAIGRLEVKGSHAIAEFREPMYLTDATRSRSTGRRKTKAQREADHARAWALCEAVELFTDDPTATAAWLRLESR